MKIMLLFIVLSLEVFQDKAKDIFKAFYLKDEVKFNYLLKKYNVDINFVYKLNGSNSDLLIRLIQAYIYYNETILSFLEKYGKKAEFLSEELIDIGSIFFIINYEYYS